MRRFLGQLPGITGLLAGLLLLGALAPSPAGGADRLPAGIPPLPAPYATWPKVQSPIPLDPAMEARIAAIVKGMTLEQKVGQMTQPDALLISPDEVRRYYIGTVLVGGDGWPKGNRDAPAADWLAVSDKLWEASMSTDAKVKIPILWGIDAVHGLGRIYGTTIFPHNIGLGAAHDPDLVRRIGAATAMQLRVSGQDWTFSPCVAVPRDDRWGRTYEGFSEDPAITRAYARAYTEGTQNLSARPDPQKAYGAVVSVKHFIGDGGTEQGRDQGLNVSSEVQLINVHGQGYFGALGAGAQTVMISFNSWIDAPATRPGRAQVQEAKIHGSKYLVTDVLKGKLGFDGLVVSDWKGHGQVPGCTNTRCARAINAGIDVFMVADEWRGFFEDTVDLVKKGEVPMARIDDAVTRILRVKMRMGLFDMPKPSARPNAKDAAKLVHHDLAVEAVRKSLVLLKNNGKALPLRPGAKLLVVGKSADSIENQTGGWTIEWQGRNNPNRAFPAGSTVLAGLRKLAGEANVTYSERADGVDVAGFDAVVAVLGETPYSEFMGDLMPGLNSRAPETMIHADLHPEDLRVLEKVSGKGKPVVTVFLSGRPLVTTKELNRSDAFVAAWLPGTEGAAIATVLFQGPDGKPLQDFTGKLAYSWPKVDCQPVNVGDAKYDPLFPFGFGLSYADAKDLPALPEPKSGACD
jgi:beta-glucosidase